MSSSWVHSPRMPEQPIPAVLANEGDQASLARLAAEVAVGAMGSGAVRVHINADEDEDGSEDYSSSEEEEDEEDEESDDEDYSDRSDEESQDEESQDEDDDGDVVMAPVAPPAPPVDPPFQLCNTFVQPTTSMVPAFSGNVDELRFRVFRSSHHQTKAPPILWLFFVDEEERLGYLELPTLPVVKKSRGYHGNRYSPGQIARTPGLNIFFKQRDGTLVHWGHLTHTLPNSDAKAITVKPHRHEYGLRLWEDVTFKLTYRTFGHNEPVGIGFDDHPDAEGYTVSLFEFVRDDEDGENDDFATQHDDLTQ